jgi:hypothetical protein
MGREGGDPVLGTSNPCKSSKSDKGGIARVSSVRYVEAVLYRGAGNLELKKSCGG